MLGDRLRSQTEMEENWPEVSKPEPRKQGLARKGIWRNGQASFGETIRQWCCWQDGQKRECKARIPKILS
jgi:hypothetical protein